MKMVAFHGSAWILEHWVINFSSFIVLHLLLLQIILVELSDHLLFVPGVGLSVLGGVLVKGSGVEQLVLSSIQYKYCS